MDWRNEWAKEEKTKHKKKSAAKGRKRSNHKHEYYEVLVKWMFKDLVMYFLGKKCKYCDILKENINACLEREEGKPWSRMLSDEEMLEKYKDLEVIEKRG